MIRDLIKRTAKRAALRAFGMEWQASESEVPQHQPGAPKPYDPNVIPRVVEGSGDTPGPNHRSNIGRTWVSAQVVSGTPPFVLDLRPPRECAAGVIPGAHVMPLDQVRQRLDALPDKAMRVIVYDQLGSDHADAIATWLREQGWIGARRLVGGFAEWIEHAEPVRVLEAPSPDAHAVGAMVQMRATGARGWVQDASLADDGPRYTVWFEDGSWRADVRAGDLAA